jgi:hypothetical protein
VDFYDLTKYKDKYIGRAIIFNNYKFVDEEDKTEDLRLGSDNDVVTIKATLKNLGFKVTQIYIDLNDEQMKLEMKRCAEKSYVNYSSFACVIMSHGGNEYEIYGVNWKTVHLIDDLIAPFTKCASLKGKPKLFLVNACRGVGKFELIGINKDLLKLSDLTIADGLKTDQNKTTKEKLDDTDVLIHYATIEDKKAYRHSAKGAYFIQSLCHVLDRYAMEENVELVHLLRMVNSIVATWFEIQMPTVSDKLTKFLSFNLNKKTMFALGNEPEFR